jgi:hypothetical protein
MNDFEIETKRVFDEIHGIWAGFSKDLIIPFCTPVVQRPDVLVIGKNHACFSSVQCEQPWYENDLIAIEMSRSIPRVNTYLEHDHRFAVKVRSLAEKIGMPVSDSWVGTNRCPIQMDAKELDSISKASDFKERQCKTDRILKMFITNHMRPKNIWLSGEFASSLFYDIGKRRIGDLPVKTPVKNNIRTHIFPLWHFSWNSIYMEKNIERLGHGKLMYLADGD